MFPDNMNIMYCYLSDCNCQFSHTTYLTTLVFGGNVMYVATRGLRHISRCSSTFQDALICTRLPMIFRILFVWRTPKGELVHTRNRQLKQLKSKFQFNHIHPEQYHLKTLSVFQCPLLHLQMIDLAVDSEQSTIYSMGCSSEHCVNGH